MNNDTNTELVQTKKYLVSPVSPPDGFSIRDVIITIWCRKSILLGTIAGLTVLTAIVLHYVTPRYTANAQLLIESRGRNIVNLDSVVSGLSADNETIISEIQVIRSRRLAQRVISELALDKNPEFNHAFREKSAEKEPPGLIATLFNQLSVFASGMVSNDKKHFILSSGMSAEEYQHQIEWSRLVDSFLKYLNVDKISSSRVIAIEFTAKNPVIATRVVNTLVALYIEQQRDTKFEATRRATEWLNQNISSLRKAVEQSEREVELFRQNSGLIEGKEGTLTVEQISQLNSQLMIAEADRTEANVRLGQIKKLIKSQGTIESASEVLDSGLILQIRAQETELQRQIAESSTEFGKQHPKMINLVASLNDMQDKLEVEVKKVIKGLENEVAVADSRVWSLRNSLNRLKGQAAEANHDTIRLNALEREAEANRLLLNTFLSRVKETTSQQDLDIHQPDATIVSRANLPIKPSFPKTVPILLLAFVASGLIGLMLVFIVEHFDVGFRSGEQIEQKTGINSLGFVPLLKGVTKAHKTPTSYIVNYPKSAFVQAINSLVWSVNLSHRPSPPKSILITSTQPEEGKTTIAICLAKKHALAGKKVIIVDADGYRPSVGKVFKIAHPPGLNDVLFDNKTLEDVIWNDYETGVDILQGRPGSNLTDVLDSDRIDALLETLSIRYDIVIIDTCPINAAPDALILSKKVDTTVFVVRWSTTKQKAVILSLQKFAKTGGPIGGVLLSMVDMKKNARYNYGDSAAYDGQLEKYFEG